MEKLQKYFKQRQCSHSVTSNFGAANTSMIMCVGVVSFMQLSTLNPTSQLSASGRVDLVFYRIMILKAIHNKLRK